MERPALKKDEFGNYVPDDKKLNMGVKVPLFNGACRLEFNYYWLKQYLKFLQRIFDSNEDLVVFLPETVHRSALQYKTKAEVLSMIKSIEKFGLKKQIEILRLYANNAINPEKIPEPCMTFLSEAGKTEEDTVTDDPQYPVLAYTRKDLVYLWSIRILAIYISLSWVERNEERGWTEETISEFIKKSKATHPIYQFRLFCTLNHIKEHLDYMADKSKEQGYVLRTVDGAPLKEELFAEVWERACDMIFSFEYAFKACWNADERGSLEKIRDGLNIIRKAAPENDKEVPFLMGYMETAQKELESYEKQWPEILEKLNKYGMFFKMGK